MKTRYEKYRELRNLFILKADLTKFNHILIETQRQYISLLTGKPVKLSDFNQDDTLLIVHKVLRSTHAFNVSVVKDCMVIWECVFVQLKHELGVTSTYSNSSGSNRDHVNVELDEENLLSYHASVQPVVDKVVKRLDEFMEDTRTEELKRSSKPYDIHLIDMYDKDEKEQDYLDQFKSIRSLAKGVLNDSRLDFLPLVPLTPYLQDNQLTLLKHEPSIPREDLGLPKNHPVVSYVFGFKNGDESYTVEFCMNAENNTQFNVVSKKYWKSECVSSDLSILNSTQEALEEIVTRLLGFSKGNN